MRRRLIILGSASVLVLMIVALVVVLLQRDVEPIGTTPSGPTFAPGELTPEETTVVATPQPDGSLAVEQTLVFDAGPGLDRPLSLYLGGTRIGWQSSTRDAHYGVVPAVHDLRAREVGQPADLAVTEEDRPGSGPLSGGRRYTLAPPVAWSPGRHVVEISFRLTNVWVDVAGVPTLVLPRSFARGPGSGQPADLVRLRIVGARGLQCPATNINFAERRSCGSGDALVYFDQDLDQVQAVVVTDPAGVSVEPVPVTEQRR